MRDFYPLGRALLDAAVGGLVDASREVPPKLFVAHGRPADDCGHLLAVYLERVRPSSSATIAGRPTDPVCGVPDWQYDTVVRLTRPDAPAPVDNADNPFPEAAVMDAHAEASYADLSAVACGLQRAAHEGTLTPWPHPDVSWGAVMPHGPAGLVAGWDIRVTVGGA